MSTLQLLVTGSVVLSFAYLAVVAGVTIIAALRAGGRREGDAAADAALAASRLTMPVSIVVPVGGSSAVSATIDRLLGLNYPEFEVIVVIERRFANLDAVAAEWQLESREFFYRRTLDTTPVRRIFRSLRDSRLMLVEKDEGSRADALNCGMNLARYRYVAVVPPAVTFDESALLRAMAPALREPSSVVGVTSHIERAPDARRPIDREARFQWLRSIRSVMFTRLFSGRLRQNVGPDDAVVIWRREAVLQANGFAQSAVDPDLDMMLRLQQGAGGEDRRFVRSEDAFGRTWTRTVQDARAASGRRQRAALGAVATWATGTGSRVGGRTITYFFGSELIAPFAECWLVIATVAGAAAGWFTWTTPVLSVVLLAFGTAATSAAALLLRGAHQNAPERAELRSLLLISPLELLLQRPGHAWARLSGVLSSARTHRSW